jgi:hypothetical protein
LLLLYSAAFSVFMKKEEKPKEGLTLAGLYFLSSLCEKSGRA